MQPTRPFSDFPATAYPVLRHLRWFREIGLLLSAGCRSLRAAQAELSNRLPDECPGITSVCKLQLRLDALLALSFGRPVELYQNANQSGWGVFGLSADGLEALRLTVEFLAEVDREVAGARRS
jgi:hypothetical protein